MAVLRLIFALTGLLLTCSCKKEPMRVNAPLPCAVVIETDWSDCLETPEGMTLILYDTKGCEQLRQTTPETRRTILHLPPGTYRPAVFSYSEPEWETLHIQDLDQWDKASFAVTQQDPSLLAAASGTPFTVSPGRDSIRVALHPADLVHPVEIHLEIAGKEHLHALTGSISPVPAVQALFAREDAAPQYGIGIPLPAQWTSTDKGILLRRNIPGDPLKIKKMKLRLQRSDGVWAVDTLLCVQARVSPVEKGHFVLDAGPLQMDAPSPGDGFQVTIGDWEGGEQKEIILNSLYINHQNSTK